MENSTTKESTAALQLAEVLDLKAAKPLAGELLMLRGKAIEVDGSHVRRLGGQCLQVLMSGWQTWAADGCDFHISNPSVEFQEALQLMGASDVAPILLKEDAF